MSNAAIDQGRHVIAQMSLALDALAADLGPPFARAADILAMAPGKVVVTGMGKAGLIGAKISATLCSTGQPSVFLDPAQALHGDMGKIGYGDVLLALSNSGETNELLSVMFYCAERSVATVAITGAPNSPVARGADAVVIYPRMPEGCPIGRAPMSSTAMMLAVGDALAAVLMQRRGFTEQDFLALHHGGYLGRTIAAEQ